MYYIQFKTVEIYVNLGIVTQYQLLADTAADTFLLLPKNGGGLMHNHNEIQCRQITKSPNKVAKSTAITSMDQTPQCGLLTSSSGGARPAFSPHYSYFTASANGHQRAASFCHTLRLHFMRLHCVCVYVRACMCVTVSCVSALPSERHTNRWGVERPRAIL